MRDDGAKRSVLIVEDEEIVALDLREQLELCGHEVDVVADAESALSAAARKRPDLVLMDIRLRGAMDGVTAAEELYICANVPVVFLTAFGDAGTRRRASFTGAYGFLMKPVAPPALASTVDLAIDKHRELTSLRQTTEWHRAATEGIDLAVVVTSANGIVRFMNRSAQQMTGWRLVEVLARRMAWQGGLFEPSTDGEDRPFGEEYLGEIRPAVGSRLPVRVKRLRDHGSDANDSVWIVQSRSSTALDSDRDASSGA